MFLAYCFGLVFGAGSVYLSQWVTPKLVVAVATRRGRVPDSV